MAAWLQELRALDEPELDALRERLLSSSLVGESTLMGTFSASRGFGLVFTERGLDEVRGRFPQTVPYLQRALDPKARAKLGGLLRGKLKAPNAFYMNLLVLEPGGAVGPHVDATLREPSGDDDAVPQLVSVLYLDTPTDEGALVLSDGPRPVARIAPITGAMVWFRGSLRHEVRPFEREGERRVSLVMEQYALDEAALARVPRFRVQSNAGFKTYLARRGS